MTTKFVFDRLVDKENFCNFKTEQEKIIELIEAKQNIVLYAPRNYGKTSLVKNIIAPEFQKKKYFILFADLMAVKDINSITLRLKNAFEQSFKDSFPVKNLLNNLKQYLSSYEVEIAYDLKQNQPSFSLSKGENNQNIQLEDIFSIIKKISEKIPCLIILDEFQDVSLIAEAEAKLRNIFQNMTDVPVILLGSKKHLLKDIFSKANSPLANWGRDVILPEIDYAIFHKYMEKRFKLNGLTINFEISVLLQDVMGRIPESINLLCYEINLNHKNKQITESVIQETIEILLSSRRERFEMFLSFKSLTEEKILTKIAKNDKVAQPMAKAFLKDLDLTPRSVGLNIKKLLNEGSLEYNNGYHISDPLLKLYLIRHR